MCAASQRQTCIAQALLCMVRDALHLIKREHAAIVGCAGLMLWSHMSCIDRGKK
jgi:hypothetical protein